MPKKDKLIDELNFKNFVRLNRKTTSKLFVGITYKKINFIIYPEYFNANHIFSHPFIQNIKHKPNMVQELLRQMNKAFKNIYCKTLSNSKYTKKYTSLARMVKQNTVKGHMHKTKLY